MRGRGWRQDSADGPRTPKTGPGCQRVGGQALPRKEAVTSYLRTPAPSVKNQGPWS